MAIERDENGQFIKGYKPSTEEELKRLISIENNIKNRKNYIGDLIEKCPRIYNIWRGIKFTEKGKKIGVSDEWNNFKVFFNDVYPSYKEGLLFRRLDTSKNYNKNNFIWVTQEEANFLNGNMIFIEYNNERLTLKEIAGKYSQSLNAIKNRYYRKDKYNYSIDEIIFGRKRKRGSKKCVDNKESRTKASKMISSYKLKDKKMGLEICDIDIDWMIENIINKPCTYCGDTNRIGCDRIDNSKGHTKNNVVPCCYECNCARNDNFDYNEMIVLGETIRKIKEDRQNCKKILK